MQILAPAAPTRKLLQFEEGTPLPFIFGAQDAASGLSCVPEMHFVQRRDQVNYAAGYEAVAGPTLTTRYFLEVK